MKNQKFNKLATLLFLIAVVSISCTKQDVEPYNPAPETFSSEITRYPYIGDRYMYSFYNEEQTPMIVTHNISRSSGFEVLVIGSSDTSQYNGEIDFIEYRLHGYQRRGSYTNPFARFPDATIHFNNHIWEFGNNTLSVYSEQGELILSGKVSQKQWQTTILTTQTGTYFLTQQSDMCGVALWERNKYGFSKINIRTWSNQK